VTRTKAKRETSAGGIVYRMATDDDGRARPLYLLIRDSYRNWGFPKGHLETNEPADVAALREVQEEAGVQELRMVGRVDTIDWFFRFRGRLIHKVCHFFLMESGSPATSPQRAEGITECRWVPYDEALKAVSYANAREVLRRANEMVGSGTIA